MPSSSIIRAAVRGDIPELKALLAELNREEGYTTSIEAEALAEALFGGDARVQLRALVAEHHATPIGMLLYYWGFDTVSSSYGYHLADIVVTKNARQKTVGTRLMQALASQCLREQGQWVSLTVLKKNSAAKEFYTAMKMSQVAVDFYAIGSQALQQLLHKK